MKFEDFRDGVVARLREFYGSDAKVETQVIRKLNGTIYDGISVQKKGEERLPTPVISLNDYYVVSGGSGDEIDECVDRIVRLNEGNGVELPEGKTFEELISWENIRDRIFPALISKKENMDLLKTLVTKDFLDLSVIYVIRVVELKAGIGHIKISKELIKRWNVDEEILHKQALYNLRKDGYGFEDINSILMGLLEGGSARKHRTDHFEPGRIYVYSNSGKVFGAAGILDEATLSGWLGNKDYYILPSSIHEMLFVRKEDGVESEGLTDIVREVNQTQVEVAERLSDKVYMYNGETGKVEMCA